MIVDKIISWFFQKWCRENLTDQNIKKGFQALCSWLADPIVREELKLVASFCAREIYNEIKKQLNEKNNSN